MHLIFPLYSESKIATDENIHSTPKHIVHGKCHMYRKRSSNLRTTILKSFLRSNVCAARKSRQVHQNQNIHKKTNLHFLYWSESQRRNHKRKQKLLFARAREWKRCLIAIHCKVYLVGGTHCGWCWQDLYTELSVCRYSTPAAVACCSRKRNSFYRT